MLKKLLLVCLLLILPACASQPGPISKEDYDKNVQKAFEEARKKPQPDIGNGVLVVSMEAAEASCFNAKIAYENGAEFILPAMVTDVFECVPVTPSVSPDQFSLFYWKNRDLMWYDFNFGEAKTLMSLAGTNEGVSDFFWSPDRKKLAFVSVDQQLYEHGTKLFVLEFDDNEEKLLAKNKYDLKVNFECGGMCSTHAGEDIWFYNENQIAYNTWKNAPYDFGDSDAARKILDIK